MHVPCAGWALRRLAGFFVLHLVLSALHLCRMHLLVNCGWELEMQCGFLGKGKGL